MGQVLAVEKPVVIVVQIGTVNALDGRARTRARAEFVGQESEGAQSAR